MSERPILFSGPMVRAILDGRKTQTRRVVTPQPADMTSQVVHLSDGVRFATEAKYRRCPYGKPGDRLWVRETWQHADWTEDGYPYIRYAADDAVRLVESIPDDAASEALMERWADLSAEENYAIDGKAADRKWRPSIFMPRWASRINLLVKDVRVERLQEISEADAEAEGADTPHALPVTGATWSKRGSFAKLWDSINAAKHPWESNPWVRVVEFELVA